MRLRPVAGVAHGAQRSGPHRPLLRCFSNLTSWKIRKTIAVTSFQPRLLPWKILGGPRDIAPGHRSQGQFEPRMQLICGQPAVREVLAKRSGRGVAVGVADSQVSVRGRARRLDRRSAAGQREPVVPAEASSHDLVPVDPDQVVRAQLVEDGEQRSCAQPDPPAGHVPDALDDAAAVLALAGERRHDEARRLVHRTTCHACFIYCLTDYCKPTAHRPARARFRAMARSGWSASWPPRSPRELPRACSSRCG
jgi:hypothetical protein